MKKSFRKKLLDRSRRLLAVGVVFLSVLWSSGLWAESPSLKAVAHLGGIVGRTVKSAGSPAMCGSEAEIGRHAGYAIIDSDQGPIGVSLVTEAQAKALFARFARRSDIPFRYPEDGCYARAHSMAIQMQAAGIESGKVFVEGDLRVETSNSPKGYVEWRYHVAPVLMMRTSGGRVQQEVFDPSLFDHPVSVEEWTEVQTRHNRNQKLDVYYRPKWVYTPGEKGLRLETWISDDLADQRNTMGEYLKVQTERQRKPK